MVCKLYFFILIVLLAAVNLSVGQDKCTPSFVRGISVSDELVLEWTAPPGNDCEISYYLIYILSRGEQTTYTSTNTSLDVGFLPTCEDAQFTVIPVSTEDILGATVTLHLQMPVHRDANVTIENVRVTQQSGGHVLLEWQVEEEFQYCTNRFRVLIYNEDYNDAVDIYVQATSALLQHIRPCEHYQFGVRAIFSLIREGPIFLMSYTTPSASIDPPTLQHLSLGSTTVDLTWQLQVFSHNRCAVSAIVIESPSNFAVTYPIQDDSDRPLVSTNIPNLHSDTLYILNVTVINVAGPSTPFLIAVQTLPES